MKLRKSTSSNKASKSPPIKEQHTSSDSTSEVTYSKTGSEDEDGHPLNFRSLQLDHRSNSKVQLSPTNSNNVESTKKCMNCNNGGTSSPSSASTTSTGKVWEKWPRILASEILRRHQLSFLKICGANKPL